MADVPTEKSLDDFFAKRDKKKKKEKGKGKESAAGPTSAALKKTKKEKEKSTKNENQDAQIDKVTGAALRQLFTSLPHTGVRPGVCSRIRIRASGREALLGGSLCPPSLRCFMKSG